MATQGLQYQQETRTPEQIAQQAQAAIAKPIVNAPGPSVNPTVNPTPITDSGAIAAPKNVFDIQKLLADNTAKQDLLFNQINGFFQPSAEEVAYQKEYQDYQKQINKVEGQADSTKLGALAGISAIEDQVIPMQFQTGQKASVAKQANLALQTLGVKESALARQQSVSLQTLQNLQATRGQKLEAAKFLYDANRNSLQDTLAIYQATAPEAISTQVDEETGVVKVITRNPVTGEVSVQNAGNTKVTTPFYKFDNDPAVYTRDGREISSEDEYRSLGGTDFSDVTVLKVGTKENKALVMEMATKYPDAGIFPTDDLASAQAKLGRSRIYAEQVRPPVGAGGGGSSAGVLGLSNQQIDNISPLVTQFQNSPIVRNYNTIGEGYSFANSIDDNSKNPADHQALIYALAKALDPESVVREGEYATVQKYSQSMIDSYGKSVSQAINGTGFLSTDAIRNIKATIGSRFQASERSYKNIYAETERRVNLIGNTDKGGMLLNNYGGAFAPTGPGSSTFTGPVNTQSAQSGKQGSWGDEAEDDGGWWKKTTNWLFGD